MGKECFRDCRGYGDDRSTRWDPQRILLINNNESEQFIKVKEYIEDHYFGKMPKDYGDSIEWDEELNMTITKDFSKYENSHYDLIVSFSNSKHETIEIINTFKKTKYLLFKICSKDELIRETNNVISSNDLLLTNHFRKGISKFLGWSYTAKIEDLSESSISEGKSSKDTKEKK